MKQNEMKRNETRVNRQQTSIMGTTHPKKKLYSMANLLFTIMALLSADYCGGGKERNEDLHHRHHQVKRRIGLNQNQEQIETNRMWDIHNHNQIHETLS